MSKNKLPKPRDQGTVKTPRVQSGKRNAASGGDTIARRSQGTVAPRAEPSRQGERQHSGGRQRRAKST
jgi:hypothetical protein